MDKEKIEQAIQHLRSHYSNTDNHSSIYDHFPPGELAKELADIQESIDYLQSLIAVEERLEYLRGEIEAERISYAELAELQELAEHIQPGDVVLLQWAGVKEK